MNLKLNRNFLFKVCVKTQIFYSKKSKIKFTTTISRIFSTKSMYVFQEINIFIKLITEVSNNTKMLVFYECTYRNSAKFSTKKSQKYLCYHNVLNTRSPTFIIFCSGAILELFFCCFFILFAKCSGL